MNCKKCKYRSNISGFTICNYAETGKTCLYIEDGIVKDRRGEGDDCKLFVKGNPPRNKVKKINVARFKNAFE